MAVATLWMSDEFEPQPSHWPRKCKHRTVVIRLVEGFVRCGNRTKAKHVITVLTRENYVPGNTEFERFDNAVRSIFTISKAGILKAEAKEKQAKAQKLARKAA